MPPVAGSASGSGRHLLRRPRRLLDLDSDSAAGSAMSGNIRDLTSAGVLGGAAGAAWAASTQPPSTAAADGVSAFGAAEESTAMALVEFVPCIDEAAGCGDAAAAAPPTSPHSTSGAAAEQGQLIRHVHTNSSYLALGGAWQRRVIEWPAGLRRAQCGGLACTKHAADISGTTIAV